MKGNILPCCKSLPDFCKFTLMNEHKEHSSEYKEKWGEIE